MARILIIDDETEFVEMLAFRLAKFGGYEVLTAFDGEEGWKAIEGKLPDLVVLDLWMPKLNGQEVLKKMKGEEKTRAIPVIVLSASTTKATLEKLKEEGAFDYIIKPFNPPELMEKIKKGLEKNV
ncbi:response regulator [Candidatus Saganbacteria bacterium]|nr:response regulator [Candidatus Saganbacteria bacterium]